MNSWMSVYKDSWCNYVSAQLHEVGHNLNLGHASEGSAEYGDQVSLSCFQDMLSMPAFNLGDIPNNFNYVCCSSLI